jgi:hypothetical protein
MTIEIELTSKRFAPWGLLTDEERPRVLIWLTEDNMKGTLDESIIAYSHQQQLQKEQQLGHIRVKGSSFLEESLIPASVDIFEVAEQVQQEMKTPEPSEVEEMYKEVEVRPFLGRKAHEVVAELKENKELTLEFLKACKEEEEYGKRRKTVIKTLVNSIEEKLSLQTRIGRVVDRNTGITSLEKHYEDMIIEEEVEIEIENPT